jgi:DNA-binding transcriptional regulator GbsR (MarR family)
MMRPERRELLGDPDKFSRAVQHDVITIKNLAGKLNSADLNQLSENLEEMKKKIDTLSEFIAEYMKLNK